MSMTLELTNEQSNLVWSALCKHEEYLINKACEDEMFDETRLEYIKDLRILRSTKEVYIESWK